MRGLYAILDPEHCAGRDPIVVARAILRGGCAAMQLRTKRLADAPRLALAREIRARCHEMGVPFVMNDRADLALLAGARGVHLGQDDISLEDARQIVGTMQVGVSTHSLAQALDAVRRGADLIGFGPVFETRTKVNPQAVVGLQQLREVCSRARVPVVAIGGITLARLPGVVVAGATLVASISGVCAAEDPEAAARAIHEFVRGE